MTPELNAPVRQASWWNRNWKWVVPVGCLGPMICCLSFVGFTYFGVSQVIQGSSVFTTALARATSNREVQDALGAPLKPSLGISGSIKENNGSGSADFSAPIEGPKGKGTLRVVATGRGGKWDYSVMEVEAGGKTINLLGADGPAPSDELPPKDDSPLPEPEDPAEEPDGD